MLEKYLKISQLARLLNDTLESHVGEAFFEGELQEITNASSGHVYCTIKDDLSALSIVLWASAARRLKFRPTKGMLVRCQGIPNVYPKSGRLQLIVSKMEPAGEGALQQKFEELRRKLAEEGLFATERKRAIPFLPKSIGLVTSSQGAALHDIMARLRVRMPHIQVYLLDVRVQGEGAAAEIAKAISYFSATRIAEVIICGRGGGSLQDLWAFNEEVVVRAIFASSVPVISAVGHETDTSLADLVADLRAPTPTAAAEMVVPNRQELSRMIAELDRRISDYRRWLMPKAQELDETFAALTRAAIRQLEAVGFKLNMLAGRIQSLQPQKLLELEASRLSKYESRLRSTMLLTIEQRRRHLQELDSRLNPAHRLQSVLFECERLSGLAARLKVAAQNLYQEKRSVFVNVGSKLEALSPHSVLQRGYSIARIGEIIVKSTKSVRPGDELTVQVSDGTIGTSVKTV